MLIKDMMKKKMERKRFLFRDSVTTINTPIGEYEVERMDSTHIKLRPMGSKDWGVPLHFNQVSSAIIDKLREVGLVAGDSFEIKDSVTDKDPSITEGSKVRINYGRFKGKRGIVKEIGVDDDYALVKVGGTTETMFIGDLKKIGFSDTMNSNGRGLAGACGEERKYDGKGPRHKSFIKDVWTKNISGYNITINGGGEDFPFKVEKNGKIVFEGESKSLSEAFSQAESKIRGMSKDSSNEENDIYYPDKNIEEADWTKKSWDLPPYKSKEFMKVVKDLNSFRKLPVYKNAVKKGLIKNDKWVGNTKGSTKDKEELFYVAYRIGGTERFENKRTLAMTEEEAKKAKRDIEKMGHKVIGIKKIAKDTKWVGKKGESKDGGPGSRINKKYRKE